MLMILAITISVFVVKQSFYRRAVSSPYEKSPPNILLALTTAPTSLWLVVQKPDNTQIREQDWSFQRLMQAS